MTPAEEESLVEKCHADWKASDGRLSFPQVLRLAIRAAVALERERCAKIADEQAWSHQNIGDIGPEMNSTAIAAAIRRGE